VDDEVGTTTTLFNSEVSHSFNCINMLCMF
jgi:hypothetical protein